MPGDKTAPADAPVQVDTAPPGRVPPPATAPAQVDPQDKPAGEQIQTAPTPSERPVPPVAETQAVTGKRRGPGALSPQTRQAMPPEEERSAKDGFVDVRDPFKQPTEILPSECPPSMPLCRFDRSQLKLVGVIQVSEGQFKGLVEDPDGRGYFITSGMQIGGATVTQVTNKGITLHVHRTRQDVIMPLFREAREAGD